MGVFIEDFFVRRRFVRGRRLVVRVLYFEF